MGIKVLIVDDFEDTREALRMVLKAIDATYQLEEAKNAEECFAKISEFGPDVILMDIMMDGMDGMQASEKIKQEVETKNIRIIYITGKDDADTVANASIIGEGFMEKPLDGKEVDAKIKEVMKKKSPIYAKK